MAQTTQPTFEKVGSCSWSRKVTLGRGKGTCKAKGTKGARKPEGCASGGILRSCEMRPGWSWTRTSPTSVGSERKAGVYPEDDREQGKGFPQSYPLLKLSFKKTKCLQLLHLALCPWVLSPLLAQNLLLRAFLTQVWSGFPADASNNEPTCQCRGYQRHRFSLQVGKIPWRRKW